MFRCFCGAEIGCIDPEYDTTTFDCLATTGPHMTKESLKDYVGSRLPPRAAIQTYGHNKEIVVIQIDQSNEFRGALPKSTEAPNADYDSRRILGAGLPHATVGEHPNITRGAEREDFQNGIMPLVTTYQCDAITGDANKSANTYSRLQWVYNPEYGLINYIMQNYQDTGNTASCAMKAIVRHHLYMKTGSGCDRTFPMTFEFGRGKADVQNGFRK